MKHSAQNGNYRDTDFAGFLEMSEAEAQIVAIHIGLCRFLTEQRPLRMSRAELAGRLSCSEQDVAQWEQGAGKAVTIDLLLEALLVIGVPLPEILEIMATAQRAPVLSQETRLAA